MTERAKRSRLQRQRDIQLQLANQCMAMDKARKELEKRQQEKEESLAKERE